jgi:hypothetical protein
MYAISACDPCLVPVLVDAVLYVDPIEDHLQMSVASVLIPTLSNRADCCASTISESVVSRLRTGRRTHIDRLRSILIKEFAGTVATCSKVPSCELDVVDERVQSGLKTRILHKTKSCSRTLVRCMSNLATLYK